MNASPIGGQPQETMVEEKNPSIVIDFTVLSNAVSYLFDTALLKNKNRYKTIIEILLFSKSNYGNNNFKSQLAFFLGEHKLSSHQNNKQKICNKGIFLARYTRTFNQNSYFHKLKRLEIYILLTFSKLYQLLMGKVCPTQYINVSESQNHIS